MIRSTSCRRRPAAGRGATGRSVRVGRPRARRPIPARSEGSPSGRRGLHPVTHCARQTSTQGEGIKSAERTSREACAYVIKLWPERSLFAVSTANDDRCPHPPPADRPEWHHRSGTLTSRARRTRRTSRNVTIANPRRSSSPRRASSRPGSSNSQSDPPRHEQSGD